MLLKFPRRPRHGPTFAAVAKPNTAGLISWPRDRASSVTIVNFPRAMRRRESQLLTADGPTPQNSASLAGPPASVTTAETDSSSMTPEYSQNVNESTVHNMEIFTNCELRPNGRVTRSQKDIAYRLELTRAALDVIPAQLAAEAEIGPNQWSQYVDPNGKRRITLDAAFKLKDEYGVTLEWIYDGDRSRLPADLLEKIRKVERAGGVSLSRTRGQRIIARKRAAS